MTVLDVRPVLTEWDRAHAPATEGPSTWCDLPTSVILWLLQCEELPRRDVLNALMSSRRIGDRWSTSSRLTGTLPVLDWLHDWSLPLTHEFVLNRHGSARKYGFTIHDVDEVRMGTHAARFELLEAL